MSNAVFIVSLILLFILSVIFIPQWRMRRAVKQVLDRFRKQGATSPKSAQSMESMGLTLQQSMMSSLWKGRDFKPYAIKALIQHGIIVAQENGTYYLNERRTEESKVLKGL